MNIEVTVLKAEPAVAIAKAAVTMEEISAVATEGLEKIVHYLNQQGVQIAGIPYLAYKNGNADFSRFDVEMGIPVEKEIPVSSGFFMSQTYEGKAVCGIHQGAYTDIEPVYMALMEYMEKNKLESTGVYYDYYVNDPADTPEKELLTRVIFPIK